MIHQDPEEEGGTIHNKCAVCKFHWRNDYEAGPGATAVSKTANGGSIPSRFAIGV